HLLPNGREFNAHLARERVRFDLEPFGPLLMLLGTLLEPLCSLLEPFRSLLVPIGSLVDRLQFLIDVRQMGVDLLEILSGQRGHTSSTFPRKSRRATASGAPHPTIVRSNRRAAIGRPCRDWDRSAII